jgi:hypothetical protein
LLLSPFQAPMVIGIIHRHQTSKKLDPISAAHVSDPLRWHGFWQWADKPPEILLTIPAELHRAVMELAPEHRRDRAAVNQAAARVPDPER